MKTSEYNSALSILNAVIAVLGSIFLTFFTLWIIIKFLDSHLIYLNEPTIFVLFGVLEFIYLFGLFVALNYFLPEKQPQKLLTEF